MARINLRSSSGLPLYYNGDEIQSDEFTASSISTITLKNIRPQLLNEDLDCPNMFYSKYKNLDNSSGYFKKQNIRVNIYLIKPNLAGIEFIKSKATKSKTYPRLFEVICGGGNVLLQKYVESDEKKIYRLQVKKGSKFIVPSGYAVCLINTRQAATFIALEITPKDARTRVVLEDMRGMSYYIIRKNAKVEVVRNPVYKMVDEVKKLDMEDILKKKGITPKTPLVKQIKRNRERYDWFFRKNSKIF